MLGSHQQGFEQPDKQNNNDYGHLCAKKSLETQGNEGKCRSTKK